MDLNSKQFTHFFPNIETTPFSDSEAGQILDISSTYFNRASKLGLIKRSVKIHYRLDIFFNFTNIFDIFEYSLRRDLFFLNYGTNPEVSELVFSLVDEFTLIIDNCLCNRPPQVDRISEDIIILCMDSSEKWDEYWLYGGDSFSAAKCSTIVLNSWYKIYEKILHLVSPVGESYGGTLNDDHIPDDCNLCK